MEAQLLAKIQQKATQCFENCFRQEIKKLYALNKKTSSSSHSTSSSTKVSTNAQKHASGSKTKHTSSSSPSLSTSAKKKAKDISLSSSSSPKQKQFTAVRGKCKDGYFQDPFNRKCYKLMGVRHKAIIKAKGGVPPPRIYQRKLKAKPKLTQSKSKSQSSLSMKGKKTIVTLPSTSSTSSSSTSSSSTSSLSTSSSLPRKHFTAVRGKCREGYFQDPFNRKCYKLMGVRHKAIIKANGAVPPPRIYQRKAIRKTTKSKSQSHSKSTSQRNHSSQKGSLKKKTHREIFEMNKQGARELKTIIESEKMIPGDIIEDLVDLMHVREVTFNQDGVAVRSGDRAVAETSHYLTGCLERAEERDQEPNDVRIPEIVTTALNALNTIIAAPYLKDFAAIMGGSNAASQRYKQMERRIKETLNAEFPSLIEKLEKTQKISQANMNVVEKTLDYIGVHLNASHWNVKEKRVVRLYEILRDKKKLTEMLIAEIVDGLKAALHLPIVVNKENARAKDLRPVTKEQDSSSSFDVNDLLGPAKRRKSQSLSSSSDNVDRLLEGLI